MAGHFKTALFEDSVYVLTPQGNVIALPKGSTPVDFAYHVHTDLGHRCRGAKVDGAIVSFDYPLQNDQQVEIIPAKQGGVPVETGLIQLWVISKATALDKKSDIGSTVRNLKPR